MFSFFLKMIYMFQNDLPGVIGAIMLIVFFKKKT